MSEYTSNKIDEVHSEFRDELARTLRDGYAAIINEADDWRPLADHVVALLVRERTDATAEFLRLQRVDKAFHDLAVKERDAERKINEKLRAKLAEVETENKQFQRDEAEKDVDYLNLRTECDQTALRLAEARAEVERLREENARAMIRETMSRNQAHKCENGCALGLAAAECERDEARKRAVDVESRLDETERSFDDERKRWHKRAKDAEGRVLEVEAENARLRDSCEDLRTERDMGDAYLAEALAEKNEAQAKLAESQAREAALRVALEPLVRCAKYFSKEDLARLDASFDLHDPDTNTVLLPEIDADDLRRAATAPAPEALDALRRVPHLTIMPWFKTTTAESGDHHPSECAHLGGQCALARVFGEVPR